LGAQPKRSNPPAPWACSRPPNARLCLPDRTAKRSCRRGALAGVSCEYGLSGPPRVRSPLPAGAPVLARRGGGPCPRCGVGVGEGGGGGGRVTVVSAPAGSGKTVLLRSWIDEAGLAGRAAWVQVGRDERDPQRFWLAVLAALRQTVPGSGLVRPVSAAPDLDGGAIVERLLTDLAPLRERLGGGGGGLARVGAGPGRRGVARLGAGAAP